MYITTRKGCLFAIIVNICNAIINIRFNEGLESITPGDSFNVLKDNPCWGYISPEIFTS